MPKSSHHNFETTSGSVALPGMVMVHCMGSGDALPLQEALNQPSVLAGRSWFLFGLNVLYAIIGLIILCRIVHKCTRSFRDIRYHVVVWARRMFRLNVDTSTRLYLELTNYKEVVYIPILDLNLLPNTLFYMKELKWEPEMELQVGWRSTMLHVRWVNNCMVAHTDKRKDIYFSLPAWLTLPWNTTWLCQNILSGPYVTHLIARHPHTFVERLTVLKIPDSSIMSPLNIARYHKSKAVQFYELDSQKNKVWKIEFQGLQPTAPYEHHIIENPTKHSTSVQRNKPTT